MKLIIAAALIFGGAAQAKSKSPLRDWWTQTLANGCTVEAAARTPIEARVLRNLPYALKGYVFKSAELTALYGADGGWYTPAPGKAMDFTPKEGACIKALKAHEARLRTLMPWPKAWEAHFTADHQAVRMLRMNTKGTFGAVTVAWPDPNEKDAWWLGGADCKGKRPKTTFCGQIQVFCSKRGADGPMECGVNTPG